MLIKFNLKLPNFMQIINDTNLPPPFISNSYFS